MNPTGNARRLRGEETDEERQLWQALKAGRFAGFKFRRQHPVKKYFLDFYCPAAKLSIELDGFQHGSPNELSPRCGTHESPSQLWGLRSYGFGIISGKTIETACC
jgi:very-short-patch-repair endonuclease